MAGPLPDALRSAAVPAHVLHVIRGLQDAGFKAYLVGGCVRDMLRGMTPKDWDVTTSARPEDVQKSFKKVLPTGVQHGTVTVMSQGTPIEVTTFRSEGAYLDGRRPSTVAFETDVAADLSRRDFTINAIAFDPLAQELCDPFGGQADIAAQVLRCVGNPNDRFTEDGLRPLRAVRFAAVLGFAIDPPTLAAMGPALPSFRKVSLERVREELSKLLTSPRAAFGLELLRTSGLLGACVPELPLTEGDPMWRISLGIVERVPAELEIRLAAALSALALAEPPADEGKLRDLVQRLKFPNRVADSVALWLRCLPRLDAPAGWPDPRVRRFLAEVGPHNLDPILQLARAEREARGVSSQDVLAFGNQAARILSRQPALLPSQLALKGQDIMRELGISPSPRVGEAARFLLDRVLDDPSLNTPAALAALLKEWSPK